MSNDGQFVGKSTTSPGTMDEVREVVKIEATCPRIVQDIVHDHEMLEEPRTMLPRGSEECVLTTPSYTRQQNKHN